MFEAKLIIITFFKFWDQLSWMVSLEVVIDEDGDFSRSDVRKIFSNWRILYSLLWPEHGGIIYEDSECARSVQFPNSRGTICLSFFHPERELTLLHELVHIRYDARREIMLKELGYGINDIARLSEDHEQEVESFANKLLDQNPELLKEIKCLTEIGDVKVDYDSDVLRKFNLEYHKEVDSSLTGILKRRDYARKEFKLDNYDGTDTTIKYFTRESPSSTIHFAVTNYANQKLSLMGDVFPTSHPRPHVLAFYQDPIQLDDRVERSLTSDETFEFENSVVSKVKLLEREGGIHK